MSRTGFKTNDRVKIVSNDLEPQYKGKVARIKKAYQFFTENPGTGRCEAAYRVEVDGVVLKGIACDSDLEGV